MNRNQLKVMWAGIIAVVAMGLFVFSWGLKLERSIGSGERLGKTITLAFSDWQNLKAHAKLENVDTRLPDRGIRGRYHIAKKVISKAVLETIVGEKAFVSGPHVDDINYSSRKEFGRYNRDFLVKLRELLADIYGNEAFVTNAQSLYDSELKRYLRTYYIAYDVGANNREIMDGYLSAISEGKNAGYYLQESFRDFSETAKKEGYDVYEASTCPGFWVRRSIDGTASQFYKLLKLTIQTFDADFLKQVHLHQCPICGSLHSGSSWYSGTGHKLD